MIHLEPKNVFFKKQLILSFYSVETLRVVGVGKIEGHGRGQQAAAAAAAAVAVYSIARQELQRCRRRRPFRVC